MPLPVNDAVSTGPSLVPPPTRAGSEALGGREEPGCACNVPVASQIKFMGRGALLMAADGLANEEIARRCGVDPDAVPIAGPGARPGGCLTGVMTVENACSLESS